MGAIRPEMSGHPSLPTGWPVPFDVAERTALAVETYKSLGISPDDGKTRELITRNMRAYFKALVADGYDTEAGGDLEVFQSYVLSEDEGALNALIVAYERFQHGTEEHFIQEDWVRYTADELNRRHLTTGDVKNQRGAISGFGQALGMQLATPTEHRDEPGLQISSWATEVKQECAQAAMESYGDRHEGTELLMANPIDYIILSAQRAVEGAAPLDAHPSLTSTHFVQLPVGRKPRGKGFFSKKERRPLHFPASAWHDKRDHLVFNVGRDDGGGTNNTGVRFLVAEK